MQLENKNAVVVKLKELELKKGTAGATYVARNALRQSLINMEMHSYAKRRISKKWGIEHKRKLVAARITYESLFANKPTNSMVPWKKILSVAKLDDFNVFFVRKQWSTMVAKYKQYKHCRLGNIPTKAIDDDVVEKITKEWEFFQSIHNFMTRKTNNLHSYALTMETDSLPQQQNQTVAKVQKLNQVMEEDKLKPLGVGANTCDGIQNEDNTTKTCDVDNALQMQNTDHDFYTKKIAAQQSRLFSDIHNNGTIAALLLPIDTKVNAAAALSGNDTVNSQETLREQTKATNITDDRSGSVINKISVKKLSERDKYYRHRRHLNNRLERRFDALLNVFGQIVKAEYPSIDVNPLMNVATSAESLLVNRMFSSNDDNRKEESPTDDQKMSYEVKNGGNLEDIENLRRPTQNGKSNCNGSTFQ